MLPLSELVVSFNTSSRDYLKLGITLHMLAVVVLMLSGVPELLQGIGGMLLVMSAWKLWHAPYPMPAYANLSHRGGYWILKKQSGVFYELEHLTLRFDGGFFILLALGGDQYSTTLIVFADQLTATQTRLLRTMRRIRPKT